MTGHTQLFVTDALPAHNVADVPGEGRWLLPATMLRGDPDALWAAARPYRGKHSLEREAGLERFAPPPDEWQGA